MIPIKSAKEIEKMRQSCRTASDILDRVSELVPPGIKTNEVDDAPADFMNEAKVKSAFPCCVDSTVQSPPRERLHFLRSRNIMVSGWHIHERIISSLST